MTPPMPFLPRPLRAATAGAVLGATSLLAACIPAPASMPAVTTARVVVPSIPLVAAPNLVLDAATFDAAALDACTAGGAAASADGFFGFALGRWAVMRLADEPTTLADQQRLLGTVFTAGFFGGKRLATVHGLDADGGPFAAIPTATKAMSTTVISQFAGQMLGIANGDGVMVQATAAAMVPLLVKAITALETQTDPAWGADVTALATSLREVVTAVHAAAAAGAAGDVAAARRAESAMAGLVVWAGGFALGAAGQLPVGDPTLTC